MINCSYPSFFRPRDEPAGVLARMVGYQANASSLEHQELDQSNEIQADAVEDWGERMLALHRNRGVEDSGRMLRDKRGTPALPGAGEVIDFYAHAVFLDRNLAQGGIVQAAERGQSVKGFFRRGDTP